MSDTFDADGLTIKSESEITEELNEGVAGIYGEDVNVESNSPDGQLIGIFAQAGIDVRELLEKVNSNFDPDQAEGVILDQRAAINGIKRSEGTFTYTPITVVSSKAVSLIGLDDEATEIEPDIDGLFTISDDAGTQYYLLDSVGIGSAGSQSLTFRAAELGKVETTANTITNIETVTDGITSVNNPDSATTIGKDEESDAEFKKRRRASTSKSSQGYIDAMYAELSDLENITSVLIEDNDTDSTDAYGTAPHTIWVIVEGGDDNEIAEAIYRKKGGGCGMRGEEEVDVTRLDGRIIVIRFDRPTEEDLYIRFTISHADGGVIDTETIKEEIVSDLLWSVGKPAVASTITTFVVGLDSDYRVEGMEVSSDGSAWDEIVDPTSLNYKFVNGTGRITITEG